MKSDVRGNTFTINAESEDEQTFIDHLTKLFISGGKVILEPAEGERTVLNLAAAKVRYELV